MPNYGLVSTIALLAWFPIALFIFATFKKERAAAIVYLGAVLFLPELAEFDFPLIPPIGKLDVGVLCLAVGLVFRRARLLHSLRPLHFIDLVMFGLIIGAIGTVMTNADPLVFGSWVKNYLPALTPHDILSFVVRDILAYALPFLLGRIVYRDPRHLKDLLIVWAGGLVLYAPFILVELRMSPQFHNWTYGYMPHRAFQQVFRWGGYRPVVFMAHGLALAIYAVAAIMAAGLLARTRNAIFRIPARYWWPVLFVVVVACKSTGAIVFALIFVPLILWGKSKTLMRSASFLALVVFLYPMVRLYDILPTDVIVQAAQALSAERSESLDFRFKNEERITHRTAERIWFGWGGFGRNLTHDEEMGKPTAILDGFWIIRMSQRGMIGWLTCFVLLLYPIALARKKLRLIVDPGSKLLVAGFALIIAVQALDLIPNGLFSTAPYFLAGALFGVARNIHAPRRRSMSPIPSSPPPDRMASEYPPAI